MTDASADIPPGAETKRTQRIDRDLYCVRCEYNLRTLTPDAWVSQVLRTWVRDSPRCIRTRHDETKEGKQS